jgi:cell division protein FtsW
MKRNALGILFLVITISLLGLLFVFEASTAESYQLFSHPYHFLQSQSQWLGIGLLGMAATAFFPPKFWKKISPILYVISLISLIMVFIPGIGVKLNGASRWFSLGGLVLVQPIEIVKLSIILFFASWMSKHQKLIPFLFLTLLPVGLLLLQPDLGSTLIILSIAWGMFFIAGGKLKYLGSLLLFGLLAIGLLVLGSSYRRQRLMTFLNPELDPLGSSFHIRQITLALGRGGWFGQGLGQSAQKYKYIPEASSDSIMSIVGEEVGFLGFSFILGLYLILFLLIYKSAKQQKQNSFAQLTIVGILIWISSQTILNLAAIVALVPLTGIPLPFFSYGGSSLVMVLCATGIVIRLSNAKIKNKTKHKKY